MAKSSQKVKRTSYPDQNPAHQRNGTTGQYFRLAKGSLEIKVHRGAIMAKGRKVLLVSLLVFGIVATVAYTMFYHDKPKTTSNDLRISGRIEAPEIHISSGTASRVQSVAVKEGDSVRKGQILVRLDDTDVQIKMKAINSAIAMAEAAEQGARAQVTAVESKIEQARAKSKGFLTKVFSTRAKKDKIETQLRSEMLQAQTLLHKASAEVIKTKALYAQANSRLSYFNIISPINGICTLRSVQPGELTTQGQVLLTIIDPKTIYMRGFIPEGNMSEVRIGQSAQVFLDSRSNKPLQAELTAIDPAPAFTPENVYFQKDRVRQVFGVKLSIKHQHGLAKPGMPADARIALTHRSGS